MKKLIFLLLLGLCPPYLYGVQIEVQALFKGAAMLAIDGRAQLLRKGQQSPEGVTLVDADSKKAVIEYQGTRKTLLLSDRISASFKAPEKAQVHITMTKNRQYIAD